MSYSFQLPPSLPNGSYLLRIEHIGVHNAANPNSAQFFVNCAQIQVTGGGNGNPGPLVTIPGLYSNEDPGIHFNNYYPPVCCLDISNVYRTGRLTESFTAQVLYYPGSSGVV